MSLLLVVRDDPTGTAGNRVERRAGPKLVRRRGGAVVVRPTGSGRRLPASQ